eukprot:15362855-Alexandrium_andersonii.AAC.1
MCKLRMHAHALPSTNAHTGACALTRARMRCPRVCVSTPLNTGAASACKWECLRALWGSSLGLKASLPDVIVPARSGAFVGRSAGAPCQVTRK